MSSLFPKRLRKRMGIGHKSPAPHRLLTEHYRNSLGSLQVFYALVAFVGLRFIELWDKVDAPEMLNPPSVFGFLNTWSPGLLTALSLGCLPVFTVTFLLPRFQALRVLTFFLLLLAIAYRCSFNKNYHGELIVLYASFAFALIPTWKATMPSRKRKHVHLHFYWLGLLLFLLPYTISGLWKLGLGMGYQLFFADISFWSFESMSTIISQYMTLTKATAPLSDFLIQHPLLGYALLIGGTYWEIIAVLPLFRPTHWRSTAVLVLIFHVLSVYILNIQFTYQIIASLFFLYWIPLQKENTSFKEWLQDLPILGLLFR